MPLRGLWLIVVAILIGVLVSVLPMPGLIHTLGYIAALICGVVGLVMLVVDVVGRGGPRSL